ncbi:MAG: CBS domain-containing protein [Patescibacteria group bacterium]
MTTTQPATIKKLVSPLASIIRGDAESTLGSVLSRVRSSHEAVFIYNDKEEFLGLVSPYKTLYSSNYPYTTKVSSIVFKPPFITKETPIYEVVKYMLAARIYVLPVFDAKGKMRSVIYGQDILQEILRNPDLLQFVSSKIKIKTPITAPINSSVKDVFYDLKEKGRSRIIVVTPEGSLAGIASRGDLMRSLIKPTSKMRVPKEGSHLGWYSFSGEKKFRKSEPIGMYSSALVDTLPQETPKPEIVLHLIASPHNSIVLTDKNNKPTGFLSTRDIFQALALLRPKAQVSINIQNPSKDVSKEELEQARKHLELFGKKIKKRLGINMIDVSTKGPKNPQGQVKMFNTTVILTPTSGNALVALTKNRKYLDGIQEATKLIEKQRKRSDLSRGK